jgi:putative ABC transport system permease protein
VLSAGALLLPILGGVIVGCVASAFPLLDLRGGRRLDAVYVEEGVPGNTLGGRTDLWLFGGAACLVVVQIVLVASWPSLALPACVLIALATVLAAPLVLHGTLAVARWLSEAVGSLTVLPVALSSLRATPLRSLVLAATGAVAIFGSVALGGARGDLLRGIDRFSRSYTADAGVWVINPDDNQAVVPINASLGDGVARRIGQLPGVAHVATFEGGLLDVGTRRVWVIARPPGSVRRVLGTQVVQGSPGLERRLDEGGWIALSRQLAAALHTRVGGRLVLSTPNGPVRFRVAATTTNLAWSPGVVFMSARDFTRGWGPSALTALGVTPSPGVSDAAARAAVAGMLGSNSGLEVSSAATREQRIDTLTSEGLGRLGQIATLLSIAAVLAMAAAFASSVWQRRTALAALRLAGAKPSRLRRILLLEGLLMLGAGSLTGAVFGLYGEHVIDGYLRTTTGFPVGSVVLSGRPLEVLAVVLIAALTIGAAPGWVASRASPRLALGET